jgi:uncharacterized membrane protein YgcG
MKAPRKVAAPSRRKGEHGTGLTLVLMITAFVAGVALVAHRSTRDAAQSEGFHLEREFRDRVITAGLAHGAELLTTGAPPRTPFLYVLQTNTPEREPPIFYTLVEIVQLTPGGGNGGGTGGSGGGNGGGNGGGGNGGGNGGGLGGTGGSPASIDFEVRARPGTAADARRYGPPPTTFSSPGRR